MVAVDPGGAGSAGVRSPMRCRFRWPAGPAGPAAGAGFRPTATGSGWLPAGARDPMAAAGSRAEVFERYLAYFRGRLAEKLRALPAGELRRSRLPSGWAPLELL